MITTKMEEIKMTDVTKEEMADQVAAFLVAVRESRDGLWPLSFSVGGVKTVHVFKDFLPMLFARLTELEEANQVMENCDHKYEDVAERGRRTYSICFKCLKTVWSDPGVSSDPFG